MISSARLSVLSAFKSGLFRRLCLSPRSGLISQIGSLSLLSLIGATAIGAAPAQAESVDLRVAIEENISTLRVGSSVPAIVRDKSRRPLGELQGMNGLVAQAKNGGIALDRWQSGGIWLEPKDANGVVWIGDRWYRGRVYLAATGRGLTAVNYVNLEQYLFSVLGSEMNGNWPQEALKAQAVAARSYALYERETSGNSLFDVGDTAGWQVYRGVQTESPGTQQAVLATRSQVMTHQGRVINAVFHASAGGCTENAEDVWFQRLPYLRHSVNPFDEGTPSNIWTKTFSASDLSNRIPGIGTIREIIPVETTPRCRRVKKARVIGDRGTRELSGERLREILGLKSTFFQIAADRPGMSNKGGSPVKTAANAKSAWEPAKLFMISGRGFGHGLGMSQWGAHTMARQGLSYQQILGQYYQNTGLSNIEVR